MEKDLLMERIENLIKAKEEKKENKWVYAYNEIIIILEEINKKAPYFEKLDSTINISENAKEFKIAMGKISLDYAMFCLKQNEYVLKLNSNAKSIKNFTLENLKALTIEEFKNICEDYGLYSSSFFKKELMSVTVPIDNFTKSTYTLFGNAKIIDYYNTMLLWDIQKLEKQIKED